jgi:penicillin-binding protein 1A
MPRRGPTQSHAPHAARGGPARSSRRRRRTVSGALAGFALWTFLVGALLAVTGAAWLTRLAETLPEAARLAEPARRPTVIVLDRSGREIARRGAFVARDVSVAELPPYLVDAVLTIEDRRFYEHGGVDLRGLARAALENLRAGRVVQGGSTLTQQLAKNLYLDNEQTLGRKAREAVLALWIEQNYSKDEILALYLNRIYFGAGAWGVEAAAQRYFGKPASEVSLPEAALLVGLLKAPSRLAPTSDVGRAEARATLVLEALAEAGVITPQELDAALAAPLRVRAMAGDEGAGYFVDWVIPQARALAGEETRDLIIATTLDLSAQRAAERAAAEGLASVADRGAEQAALVALAGDGAVLAMVGGRSYAESQFNRAVQAHRQPGSAFKSFVYAAAIESGLSPWDVRSGAPIRLGDWSPQNFDDRRFGDMTLIDALAQSINTVAVRVAEEVGRDHVIDVARRMGITSRLRPTRSMALGSYEVTPIELTAAYSVFANGGYRATPYAVTQVSTFDGEVLWTMGPPTATQALDPDTAALMDVMLAGVVAQGTARAAALPGRTVAGKTGTTNEFRDAWFIGYVPGLVAGVWVGADEFSPMERVTGGLLPARIWRGFMTEALKNEPVAALATETDPIGARIEPAAAGAGDRSADRGLDEASRRELEALLRRIEGR